MDPQKRNYKIIYTGIGAVVLIIILVLIYFFTQKKDTAVDKVNVKNDSKIEKILPGSSGNNKEGSDNTEKQEKKFYNTPGRFPEGSTRYLSENEVNNLSKWDMKIMRNEIYARHGYIFKTEEMSIHFENQSWYEAKYENVDNMLSDIELANIKLIKEFE